jgi:uncharacterized damage-inducible protein DinB
MATDKLEQAIVQMNEGCEKLVLRFLELTEQDLAKAGPEEWRRRREWAQSVGGILAFVAEHNRQHVRQIVAKREALGLQQTPAQKILADVMASQAETDGALIGLTDEDLESVPEGQTWAIDQLLEHVAMVYGGFTSRLEEALEG